MAWLGDDDQLNKNALLFIFIRKNSDADVKIKDVIRCLDQGGDVNAVDKNDGENTPLHVAARRAEAALVCLLLDRGADVTRINVNRETPLEIARAYQTQYKVTVNLLKNIEILIIENEIGNLIEDNQKEIVINDFGDTPLHEAARRGNASAISLLIKKGADVTRKNWNGSTPLDIASELHTLYKRIVELLEDSVKSARNNDLTHNNSKQLNDSRSQSPNNSDPNNCQPSITKENVQNNAQKEYTYNKKEGTLGAKGFLYEIRLLSLILIRALNDKQIQDFLLGTNLDRIGALDDICLWYQVKNQEQPFRLFVQTKHRQDPEKNRLTVKEVKSPHGDFSLQKYFKSYTMIRNRFLSKDEDPMFMGDFINGNFVLYTSACVSDCFENQDKKKTEPNVNKKIHNLIHTNPMIDPFQYKYDEGEIDSLAKKIVIEQLKELGSVFLELIMSEKRNKNEYDTMLFNKLIAKYHVIMGREVLQQQEVTEIYREWKLRPEFFVTQCEYLTILNSTFIKEISTKRYDRSLFTDKDCRNVIEVLRDQTATNISRLIGKLAIYNEDTNYLQLREDTAFKIKFEENKFNEVLAYFNETKFSQKVISEAAQIKLKSLKIRLPVAFGNLDMTFRGCKTKVQKRAKAIAKQVIGLFDNNENFEIINIKEEIIGPRKTINKGTISIDGGIGGAVGNLLILDPDTNALKFDLDKEALPENAALFLKELKDAKYKKVNENLCRYRFNVNVNEFPIYSFDDDECDKINARGYLNKLLFYANQAKEEKVEDILKSHINEYYHGTDSFTISADPILLKVQDEIQKWSFESGRVKYLNRTTDPFKRARIAIINDLFKWVSFVR